MSRYIKLPSGKKARRSGSVATATISGYKIVIHIASGNVVAVKIKG